MGANFKNKGDAIRVEFAAGATHLRPATFEAGDPVLFGNRPGVAKTARDRNSTTATIWFYGTYDDIPTSNGARIEPGGLLYFGNDPNGSAPWLGDRAAPGFRWGYAEERLPPGGSAGARVTVGY